MPGGSQWVEAVAGLIVGCMVSLASLVVGQHLALYIYHKLNPGAFIPYGSPAPEQAALEEDEEELDVKGVQQQQQQQGRQRSSAELGRMSGGSVRGRAVVRTVSAHRQGSATLVMVEAENEPSLQITPQAAAGSSVELPAWLGDHQQQQQQQDLSPFAASPLQQRQASGSSSSIQLPHVGRAAMRAAAVGPGMPIDSKLVEVVTEVDDDKAAKKLLPSVLLVDGFAVLSICLLTSISIWRVVLHTTGQLNTTAAAAAGPFDDHFLWWAILFGPVGCYLRFYLSRYNGALHGHWKWFPAGTFAANLAACVLDYVIKAAEARAQGLGAVQLAILNGAVSGVGGCLSTVSTWVVEVSYAQCGCLSYVQRSYVNVSYMKIGCLSCVQLIRIKRMHTSGFKQHHLHWCPAKA
jgi:fluoride ion exporter CrcB/FEX